MFILSPNEDSLAGFFAIAETSALSHKGYRNLINYWVIYIGERRLRLVCGEG